MATVGNPVLATRNAVSGTSQGVWVVECVNSSGAVCSLLSGQPMPQHQAAYDQGYLATDDERAAAVAAVRAMSPIPERGKAFSEAVRRVVMAHRGR